jgi:MFS family permease
MTSTHPTSAPPASGDPAATPAPRSRWLVLTTLCLGFFIILLDMTIVNIAVPELTVSLQATLDQVLWIVNAYTLACAALLITGGRLGDLYGPLGAAAGSRATPGEAVRGFLDAFAVPAQRIPVSLEAQASLYRSLLAGRRVLIVLDNAARPSRYARCCRARPRRLGAGHPGTGGVLVVLPRSWRRCGAGVPAAGVGPLPGRHHPRRREPDRHPG